MDNQEIVAANVNSTDPNDVVAFTQAIRYRMFDELTENGKNLTAKFNETSQLLRDMDSSALTTRKLNIEAKQADTGKETLESFHRLEQMLGGRDPFAIDNSAIPVAERVSAPLRDGVVLPEVTMVPGEDAQGEQQLSISHYVSEDG